MSRSSFLSQARCRVQVSKEGRVRRGNCAMVGRASKLGENILSSSYGHSLKVECFLREEMKCEEEAPNIEMSCTLGKWLLHIRTRIRAKTAQYQICRCRTSRSFTYTPPLDTPGDVRFNPTQHCLDPLTGRRPLPVLQPRSAESPVRLQECFKG